MSAKLSREREANELRTRQMIIEKAGEIRIGEKEEKRVRDS